MPKGIDASRNCSQKAADLRAAGIDFVGRYYAPSGQKVLARDEAHALSAAGLRIVAVWETRPTNDAYFSFARGADDGTSAYRQAMAVGQPAGTPIYFAVDYDASPVAITGCIGDYFKGVAAGFQAISQNSPAHTIGAYGSGATCAWLLDRDLAIYAWLSQSKGWRGYGAFAASGRWNIRQGPETTIAGLMTDSNEAVSDNYGGFLVSSDVMT